MLDQIRIVLVNTSHPGNIGSCARAMKTMGLTQLYLVDPVSFPDPKALEMASGAVDILDKAVIVPNLTEAIADCHFIVGTSTRSRKIPWPICTPRALVEHLKVEAKGHEIAILFGRERTGLLNEELQCCHMHVQIPANPEYSSLNIAAALQVIAYELYVASLEWDEEAPQTWDYRYATQEEMEKFFTHLQDVLIKIDFLKLNAPRKLMTRLRRLFLRARLDVMEMNILRGFLAAIDVAVQKELSDGNCRTHYSHAVSERS